MKKTLACVLSLVFLLSFAAGCGKSHETTSNPTPSPEYVIPREDGEIPLDGLRAWHFSVDEKGYIYVDNTNQVIKINHQNDREAFIDGLTNCVGISAAVDQLYIFDVRAEGLVMLLYSFDGDKLEEKSIQLNENPQEIFSIFVFDTVPFAYIQFNGGSGVLPYLYGIETGEAKRLDTAHEYEYLTPLANGRLLGPALGKYEKYAFLTIQQDGRIVIGEAPKSYGASYIAYDIASGRDYMLDTFNRKIVLVNGDSIESLIPIPFEGGSLPLSMQCVKGTMYMLFVGKTNKLVTINIPDFGDIERRTLRIFSWAYRETDVENYINAFQLRYPEILVEFVSPPESSTYFLQLMSGELDVDIIWGSTVDYNTGIYRDLSKFPSISQALENLNLLEGVRENCVDPDGHICCVPYAAYYSGYSLNIALFTELGLTPPSWDWTAGDFFQLAKQVFEINKSREKKVYVVQTSPKYERYLVEQGYGGVSTSPHNMGVTSANRCVPLYDTPEMIRYIQNGRELFDLFPYLDTESESEDENILMRRFYAYSKYFKLPEEWLEFPFIPLLPDIYGNRISVFSNAWSIYTRAKNPDDAALFIAGFLDEDYHRGNVEEIQLFKNTSQYERLEISPIFEELIALITKDATMVYFSTEITQFYFELEVKYFAGEITVDEFVKELQRRAEQVLMG